MKFFTTKAHAAEKARADKAQAQVAALMADNATIQETLEQALKRAGELDRQVDRLLRRAGAAEKAVVRTGTAILAVQALNAELQAKIDRMTSGLRQNRKPVLEMVA